MASLGLLVSLPIFKPKPLGEAQTKSIPSFPQRKYKERVTLLSPSPIKATLSPLNFFFFSKTVKISAMAWQGCSRSERPLITEILVSLDRSISFWCSKTLAIIMSTILSKFLAISPGVSLTPI